MSEERGLEIALDGPTSSEDFYQLVKTAVKAGDLDKLKAKLSDWRSHPSIADPSPEQINYLVPQAAGGQGQRQVVEYLLSLEGEIGAHSISLATSPAIFQIFAEHGFETNNTILFSHTRYPDLIELFLSHGADPNISGRRGISPLDIAALHGLLETVKLLLDHGVIIRLTSGVLHAAAQSNSFHGLPSGI